VPNNILNDENLSLKAKGLFAFLQSKPDGWSFSVERISAQTKDGKDSVRSTLRELEESGLLHRVPRKDESGKWSGYDYILSEKPSSENPSTVIPSSENTVTLSNKDNSKKDIVIKNKNINAQAELERLFDEFWQEYPKKIAKKKAQQIFFRILKKKKNKQPLFNEIMTGLKKYKQTPQWKKDNGAYIPHPTTWLNQERWTDDISTQTTRKKVIKI